MDEVTLFLHEIGYAAPHPEAITSPDTYVYPGTPYWIKPEGLHDYVLLCIRHGKHVVVYGGN